MKTGESTHEDIRHYRFGGYILDTRARELRRFDGVPVALTAKAFDVLCVLVQERDRVVGRDELFAQVWPGRVVEENTLTQAVSALRHALGAEERYVVTVPGRGYRFVAEVAEGGVPAAAAESNAATWPEPAPRRENRVLWTGAVAALMLVAGLAWYLRASLPSTRGSMPGSAATVRASAPALTPVTLAVLPFRPLSAGTDQDEWLGLGLADTLITRLGASTGLRAYPLSSSRRLADARKPLDDARQIGADYVVEGNSRRVGDNIQVDVRLLAAADGDALWSGSFEERADRVFTLQDRIAAALFAALAVKGGANGYRSPCDGDDAEAYRAYLRGRYQMGRPSADRMRRAVIEFQRALELDPTCARAYAGLANAYRAMAAVADAAPDEVFPLAKAAVARALELDPDLAEAHVSRGWIQLWYDWDWAASEASFRRAIELDPDLPEAHFGYGNLLMHTGRLAEAAGPMGEALALDPLSPVFNAIGGWVAAGQGGGNGYLDRALQLDPDYFLGLVIRGVGRQMAGDDDSALADLERARRLCGDCSHALATLGVAEARAGHDDAARAILSEMEARDREGYWPASSLAALHSALGETDVALDLLERARREHDMRMSFLLVDYRVRWANLQNQPRFIALMRRMNLSTGEAPVRTNTPASASNSSADRNSR